MLAGAVESCRLNHGRDVRKRSGFITAANFVVDGGMTRKMIYEE
jgi:hypothetical protein